MFIKAGKPIPMEKFITSKIFTTLRKVKYFVLYNYYVIRNRNLDYFDYNELAVNFPIFTISSEPGIIGNKCYGNLKAVKRAFGSQFDTNCMIEHGLYFGEYVIKDECRIEGLTTIYTYGEYRLNAIKSSGIEELKNVDIMLVGPYIKYVDNFCSLKRLNKIKNIYGRILLVFPYHSSPEVELEFDIEKFITRIKEVALDYDSVFVSMFWLDIVCNNHKFYSDAGFNIVSSGHRNDPYFLQRQRDLIDLADMTMSNDIGTHIGYCVSLGKPHYLYGQKIFITNSMNKSSNDLDENYWKIYNKERELFYNTFSTTEPRITNEQIELVEYYWGKEIK